MTLIWMSVLIFIATFGFVVSLYYFLIEVPAGRKRLRQRLQVVQWLPGEPGNLPARPDETATGSDKTPARPNKARELMLRRPDLIDTLPVDDRLVSRIPAFIPYRRFMQQAAMHTTAGRLLLICAGLALFGLAGGIAAGIPLWLAVGVAAGLGSIPFMVLAYRRQRRLNSFETAFPDAIDLLSRVVRAGNSLTTGLELVISEVPEPIAGEFRIVYDQQNLGVPLRDALCNLAIRVPLPDVAVFVTALQIQRETGGNLVELLDNLSDVMRERFKLYRQVRTVTAEGRISLRILMVLPPLAAAFYFIFSRHYIMTLFTEPLGRRMLTAAILMQAVGYLVIRRITHFRL